MIHKLVHGAAWFISWHRRRGLFYGVPPVWLCLLLFSWGIIMRSALTFLNLSAANWLLGMAVSPRRDAEVSGFSLILDDNYCTHLIRTRLFHVTQPWSFHKMSNLKETFESLALEKEMPNFHWVVFMHIIEAVYGLDMWQDIVWLAEGAKWGKQKHQRNGEKTHSIRRVVIIFAGQLWRRPCRTES